MRQKHSISFWYIVIFLSLVTILLWFFTDVRASQKTTTISKVAQEAAKPIKNSLNSTVTKNIIKRQVISEVELNKTKPYSRNASDDFAMMETPLSIPVNEENGKTATPSGTHPVESGSTGSGE